MFSHIYTHINELYWVKHDLYWYFQLKSNITWIILTSLCLSVNFYPKVGNFISGNHLLNCSIPVCVYNAFNFVNQNIHFKQLYQIQCHFTFSLIDSTESPSNWSQHIFFPTLSSEVVLCIYNTVGYFFFLHSALILGSLNLLNILFFNLYILRSTLSAVNFYGFWQKQCHICYCFTIHNRFTVPYPFRL